MSDSFEEWWCVRHRFAVNNGREDVTGYKRKAIAREAWDYQQTEIARLKGEIARLKGENADWEARCRAFHHATGAGT